ncbi:hypothetical protein K490DRAFT_63609 [Saccharata proteae CBS 121410]|uniref:Uncharacterized protein n=1 Tax=Saccharata proteae CBS 121410 TaxID=1314787 RepID=A0A6A5YF81_9PEZI|nr:hypothetical protein K490DRAFT_63609 [Saccharata proteae CBS 121410]
MGRSSKFSFPLPGRRAQAERDLARIPPPEHQPHYPEDVSQPSKAERLLGTGIPRQTGGSTRSRSSSATPSLEHQNNSHVSIALSEASSKSRETEAGPSSSAAEDRNTLAVPPRWPQLRHRHSSNSIQTPSAAPAGPPAPVGKPVHGKESSSTLRSYYDAKRTPLAISQQTSASAAAYGGLHKARSRTNGSTSSIDHYSIPTAPPADEEDDVDDVHRRKKKPAKLDLSKLFPKAPKDKSDSGLLSPAKFVSSPAPMSSASMFFPNNRDAHKPGSIRSTRTTETVRDTHADIRSQKSQPSYRDHYDNAKVNIRRPPPGIQHWFEGLSEEDEEEIDEAAAIEAVLHARSSRHQSVSTTRDQSPHGHGRRASRNAASQIDVESPRGEHQVDLSKTSHFSMTTRASGAFYNLHEQPSQVSLASHMTGISSKTKASKLSTSNLHTDTVLSLSSSDEDDVMLSPTSSQMPLVRDSVVGSADFEDDVIIGRAQAFEIVPRPKDRRSVTSGSDYSVRTNTTAATIDVMLSPTAQDNYLTLPRHSRSRKSSHHSRQPSAIPEDEARQRTGSVDAASLASVASPDSSSVRSARTSKSEPRSHMGHKLMAVTEEEEVLLELMRRKRAAMAKHSFTEGYRTAIKLESHRATPSTGFRDDELQHPRTSGFLSMESPVVPEKHHHRHTSSKNSITSARRSQKPSLSQSRAAEMVLNTSTPTSTETLVNASHELNRSRPSQKGHKHPHIASQSLLRDSGTSDTFTPRARSEQTIRHEQIPQLSPARLSFSPLDIFPSPPDSPTFPATASHTDTLPSPTTPGLCTDEMDLMIKVAGSSVGSEASYSANTDVESFHLPGSHYTKPAFREKSKARESSHGRRRTAGSGVSVDVDSDKAASRPSTSLGDRLDKDTQGLRKARSSNVLSTYAPPVPVPTLSALRTARSSITSTSTNPSSYKPSVVSSRTSRQNSVASQATSAGKRESASIGISRSAASTTHNSVSEDILAAWGSLGGLRGDFERI